ncbi:MAG: hypothetical protein HY080_01240 [Gammaproteobacteria bacterium]|nr:hypothetical protein [Gammaproteobacteria bacterium]
MDNALRDWLDAERNRLGKYGVTIKIVENFQPRSYGADIDCANFVGSICYWPENIFEAIFNDCGTGNVLILETNTFNKFSDFDAYMRDLLFRRLRLNKEGD